MREKNLMSYDRKGIKLFNNVLSSFKLNDTYFITEYDEIIHNYFGDKYHQSRDEQIKATKWWVENFFTEKYSKNSLKTLKEIVSYNSQEELQFSNIKN